MTSETETRGRDESSCYRFQRKFSLEPPALPIYLLYAQSSASTSRSVSPRRPPLGDVVNSALAGPGREGSLIACIPPGAVEGAG